MSEREMVRPEGASGPGPGVDELSVRTEPLMVNIGPHHPSTHGVFRMRVLFDGEEIADVEPVFGYLHRGSEKLAEERTYTQVVALTDRMDYVSAMVNNQAYILAVEKLAGIEPMPRGVWLRMIAAELQRIANHVAATGFLGNELGTLFTPLMYGFRAREYVLDLFEMLCGARVTTTYVRASGVFMDAPEEFWPALDSFLEMLPGQMDELEGLLTENEVVLVRLQDVGVLSAEEVLNASLTGPVARASGVDWDLRHRDGYEYYDRVDFKRPLGTKGDNFDRYIVRIREARESARIIAQCVEQIEPGPVR
ncbi:MAG: NADH-quinone oxidoreductase subunit D, partial [Gemmatimonadetes bacterium]|nr:NADH-quinone oxidoreductase subunit D [Gemmatimonadota bacterium]